MATFLFDKTIFGPVKSRRLGISLGINLLPSDSKVCSFDCIYCECGRNERKRVKKAVLPARNEVKQLLEAKLLEMASAGELPDVITFAGNGEPTLHPDFEQVIDDTLELRNRLAPLARIAVLSNATMLHQPSVVRALLKVEDNIQKLDSAIEDTIRLIDCPSSTFSLSKVVAQLKAFNGKVIIQTMFIKGTYKDQVIDNTTEQEIAPWLQLIEHIQPSKVMIYTIDRDTPTTGLQKVTLPELQTIAERIKKAGFEVSVSG